jgi:hypothetical protein
MPIEVHRAGETLDPTEAIEEALRALKAGIRATVVGVFDDDRGLVVLSSEADAGAPRCSGLHPAARNRLHPRARDCSRSRPRDPLVARPGQPAGCDWW